MPETVDLSLILACYNEETFLESAVQEIVACLHSTRLTWEIIFVDDESRDNTRAVIDRIVAVSPQLPFRRLFHQRNTGRGGAVADGFRAAVGEIAGYIDVDLEVGPWYIPACCCAIRNGSDVVVGNRTYRVTPRGVWRYVISQGYRTLVRAVLPGAILSDTESGYKFFRRAILFPLLDEVQDQGWFWDTEIMVRAWSKQLRIAEVQCLYTRNFQKASTVRSVKDSLTYLRRLWRFRRNTWPGLLVERSRKR